MTDRAEPGVTPLTAEEDERVLRVEDMGPVERAYAEAMHEGCEDGPPHPLDAHSPWRGDEVGEPWEDFTAALARHGLSLTLDAATPRPGLVEALDATSEPPKDAPPYDSYRNGWVERGQAIRAALASGTGEPGLTLPCDCDPIPHDRREHILANDKGADPTPEPK